MDRGPKADWGPLLYGREEEWFSILFKRLYKKKEVIWEVETGGLEIQGHSPLHSEFKGHVGHLRLCLKKRKERRKETEGRAKIRGRERDSGGREG